MTTATERRVIGAGRLANGRLYVLATKGDRNTLYWMDPGQIKKTKWDGLEVRACCTCGDRVVCLTEGEAIYVVSHDVVTTIVVPSGVSTLNSCAPLSESRVVAGGAKGTIMSINVSRGRARPISLAGQIERPGREILRVRSVPDGVLLIGRDELLVKLNRKRKLEWSASPTVTEPNVVCFSDAAMAAGKLWLSATVRERPYLAMYDRQSDGFRYYDAPGAPVAGVSPVLESQGERLLTASRVVYAGLPDHWQACADLKGPVAASIVLGDSADYCDVVTYNGDVIPVKLP